MIGQNKKYMIEDFFITEEQKPVLMSQTEFFNKTKAYLNKVADSYSQAWTSRLVRDGEYPNEGICDKCTGCGTLTAENGLTMDCIQDNGQCFIRFMDYEQFSIDIESNLSNLYELLSVDVISV